MNYNGFEFDEPTKRLLDEMDAGGRLPHALIIESEQEDKAAQLALFLSMAAVCDNAERPCGVCKNCLNAQKKNHPDVQYLQLEPKKKQYTVDQMRALIADAYILPNEANAKVYVLEQCDDRFSTLAQNTFLKLSEEPPQNVFFILLCKSARRLLTTILSRFTVIRLKGSASFDDDALAAAKSIAEGIVDTREYPLLKALLCLQNKEQAGDILAAVKQSLRDALVILSGGDAIGDRETAQKLASRLTRKKLLQMMELCDAMLGKIKQNGNINLLITWMCGEFRRITWQR
ncbi:MAG: hypothetical protein ABS987_00120 [Ruminococcus sp.]